MNFKNKTILVTGGAGFIGSHVSEQLLTHEPDRLILVDDFSLGNSRNIEKLSKNETCKLYIIDASQYELMYNLFQMESIDVVFNLAVVPLPASLEEPKNCVDKNVLIVSTLCELLYKEMYDTLIHISSSEAYGTSVYTEKPMDEDHPTYPTTPYAASKLAGDHIALSYHKTFGMDISIARPFNAYGPRQNEKSYAGVIPLTISRIMRGESPIINGDGLQTRDYTYVEDIANAIPKFYEEKNTRGKIINLASGKEVTIKKLIDTIIELTGYDGPTINTPPRPGDVRRHLGDISLAKKLIHYKPDTDFKEGLEKTINWYTENIPYVK